MIIKVHQTKANLKKEFEIYFNDNLQYTGKQSGGSSRTPSWLFYPDGNVRFHSSENKKAYWRNRLISWGFALVVLFVWLTSDSVLFAMLAAVIYILLFSLIPNATKVCTILEGGGEQAARIRHITKGLLTGYYSMECGGREYRMYTLDRSHYQYISVYVDGAQIAQINKDLHTVNNRDSYTLYLLDEEAAIADLLAMFILYYDNYECGNYGEAFVGHKKNWSWTWSKTDRFYDKAWLPSHFGWSVVDSSGYPKE